MDTDFTFGDRQHARSRRSTDKHFRQCLLPSASWRTRTSGSPPGPVCRSSCLCRAKRITNPKNQMGEGSPRQIGDTPSEQFAADARGEWHRLACQWTNKKKKTCGSQADRGWADHESCAVTRAQARRSTARTFKCFSSLSIGVAVGDATASGPRPVRKANVDSNALLSYADCLEVPKPDECLLRSRCWPIAANRELANFFRMSCSGVKRQQRSIQRRL